ncbi:MAG: hypothetical protein LBV03_05180 [Fusobacteriales bacterium]|jgi:hypothetical protein|nr:hypothetical protein [Fusobacteriales bacterium]
MRRQYSLFNGKRYVLNKNTGVCHDLDNEDKNCQIDEIKTEHLYCSDYLYSDIKKRTSYKEKCDYCMNSDK